MADLLTPAEVAALVRLTPKTLRNLRHRGGGPPFVKVGQAVRYRRDAVEAWLAERTYSRTHDRFWSKVDKSGKCWLWTACRKHDGYGRFSVGGHGVTPVLAHRYAYELLVGPIPEGLVIDHLCRVRHCVNPAHMEPVTNAENTRRGVGRWAIAAITHSKTHCSQGHPYDQANTYMRPDRPGHRQCRTCNREREAERRARLKAVTP